ncbi:MAG TPA: hypothetical protein VHE54_09565 [Puia sp.]|nr:hypothetical protein [Puia sp.]
MTPEETRLLIDHLDETLTGTRNAGLDRLLEEDPEAAQEWQYLGLAVEAVKAEGLHAQVASVRAAWKAEDAGLRIAAVPETVPPAKATVHRLYKKYGLRAAACVLIVASSAFLYKYLSVSSQSLYDRYYSTYELNTSRGAGDERPVVKAYDAKDWSAVLSIAGSAKNKDNQAEFLSGIADLQLKKYDDAISHFEQIIAVNTIGGTDYYQDEAEYYLAISWLAMHKVNEAMPILEKIRSDAHHQYHEKVAKMSFFDLRLAQFKENK